MAASLPSSFASLSAPISAFPLKPTSLPPSSIAPIRLRGNPEALRLSVSSSFRLSASASAGDAPVQSNLIDSMRNKIKEQLGTDNVLVTDVRGDGRHVSIEVVSSEFEGKSSMNRQRMVYKAIWEELQSVVHAVDSMRTLTPEEFAQENGKNGS